MKIHTLVEVLHKCPGDEGALIPLATKSEQSKQWIDQFEDEKGVTAWGTLVCRYCGLQLKVEKYITSE
jgi:hypothetical protein